MKCVARRGQDAPPTRWKGLDTVSLKVSCFVFEAYRCVVVSQEKIRTGAKEKKTKLACLLAVFTFPPERRALSVHSNGKLVGDSRASSSYPQVLIPAPIAS